MSFLFIMTRFPPTIGRRPLRRCKSLRPASTSVFQEASVKVVIQIPCLNEERTLPLVLEGIPRRFQASTALSAHH